MIQPLQISWIATLAQLHHSTHFFPLYSALDLIFFKTWHQLFRQDVDQLEHAALPFCLRLMKNNLWTCNLPNFIQTILPLLEEIETRDPDTITTCVLSNIYCHCFILHNFNWLLTNPHVDYTPRSNANRCNAGLFIFRVILKHMIASHKGPNFLTQVKFDASPFNSQNRACCIIVFIYLTSLKC